MNTKYKILWIWLLLSFGLININGQSQTSKNNTIMHKTIDFELLEKKGIKEPVMGTTQYEYTLEYEDTDGSLYKISGNRTDGFTEWEIPKLPIFYKVYSEYYGNGIQKLTGKVIGNGGTRIGIWEYFDENGKKIKETNEDAKYGAFDYNKVLIFFHLKGLINLETGENRQNITMRYNEKEKVWTISVTNEFYMITKYKMHGETGDIISSETYQGGEE